MRLKFSIVLFTLLFSLASVAGKAYLLADDTSALQARIDILQQAEKEILVEYYSIWNDEQSVGTFKLLIDAAKRGVKVKVLMDAIANTVPRSLIGALEEQGKTASGVKNLEIRVYNPISLRLLKLTHRTHSKMIIVDGETMISGGRNIGDKYFGLNSKRNYQDIDVMVSGEVVTTAHANYKAVWNSKLAQEPRLYENDPEALAASFCAYKPDQYDECENKRIEANKKFDKEMIRVNQALEKLLIATRATNIKSYTSHEWLLNAEDKYEIEFISHIPDQLVTKNTNTMTQRLGQIALTAKYEINIISPYLIMTPELQNLFQILLDRSIKIKIITNSLRSTDNLFAQAAYRADKEKFIKMGIELYEFNGPDTMHAKVAVIDQNLPERIALIGTFNLDPRSANINREIGLKITAHRGENDIADQLVQRIETARASSTLVGKDGVEYNKQKDYEGVKPGKKLLLKIMSFILPLIKNQI